MHDLEFEHLHVSAEDAAVNEVAWAADNVELTTVGIDIGSSTSHLMFARVHLQRLSAALSSRFVVVERKILWQSPILLTPYRGDYTIDVDELAGFIGGCYAYAGIEREQVDSGAVILTGEALKRRNARAIADLSRKRPANSSAPPPATTWNARWRRMARAPLRSRAGTMQSLLNVDIGGGTTKFALIEKGRILATCAIAIGGRLMVEDERRSHPHRAAGAGDRGELASSCVSAGTLAAEERKRIASRMARMIMGLIDLRQPGELARRLLVTEPWPAELANKRVDALTFSGGVAEYLYKRETRSFGDLGSDLAEELRHVLAHRRDLPPVWDPGQGIRATVIGAAQFSVQISGNTILIADPNKLPLQNLPVLACSSTLDASVSLPEPLLRMFVPRWRGPISRKEKARSRCPFRGGATLPMRRLHAVAAGICEALPRTLAEGYAVGAADRRRRRQEPWPA